jgi:hypothetical protein
MELPDVNNLDDMIRRMNEAAAENDSAEFVGTREQQSLSVFGRENTPSLSADAGSGSPGRPAAVSTAAAAANEDGSVPTAPVDDPEAAEGGVDSAKGGKDAEAPPAKPASRGYLCRTLVCLTALILVACAGLVVALGMRVGPSKWLPFMLGGAARADRISSFSLVSGIVMVVFGVLGCIGALKRMKPCLYLFGLLVLTLMAAAAGCLLLGAEAKSAVAEWRDASYRLDNLTAPALETLGTLHSQARRLRAQPSSRQPPDAAHAAHPSLRPPLSRHALRTPRCRRSGRAW